MADRSTGSRQAEEMTRHNVQLTPGVNVLFDAPANFRMPDVLTNWERYNVRFFDPNIDRVLNRNNVTAIEGAVQTAFRQNGYEVFRVGDGDAWVIARRSGDNVDFAHAKVFQVNYGETSTRERTIEGFSEITEFRGKQQLVAEATTTYEEDLANIRGQEAPTGGTVVASARSDVSEEEAAKLTRAALEQVAADLYQYDLQRRKDVAERTIENNEPVGTLEIVSGGRTYRYEVSASPENFDENRRQYVLEHPAVLLNLAQQGLVALKRADTGAVVYSDEGFATVNGRIDSATRVRFE